MKKQQKTDYFENITKPSLFLRKPSFLLPLICKNKPNSKKPAPLLTPEITATYNDSNPENPKKNKPKTNPNKPNFRSELYPDIQAPTVMEGIKTNPKQSQTKPNTNPIQSQTNPISAGRVEALAKTESRLSKYRLKYLGNFLNEYEFHICFCFFGQVYYVFSVPCG